MYNIIKHELQNIISGKSEVRNGAAIQAAAGYLRRSAETSTTPKEAKHYKTQEKEILINYINHNNLLVSSINLENFVSQGAEQKVYLKDGSTVTKLNDAIFFNSWEDYFYNLLLHNYFFPDTAYELKGFFMKKEILFAVVNQPYVKTAEKTDLQLVKNFMFENGFLNTRNNDYHHPELNIILEDLHDENVLTKNGVLQFIDTVFYLTENFWKD